jgi:DNA-binding transcriptional regulator GbsR (MarR family)
MIKRLINDSNFNVVLYDLRILGVLSRGLRRNFYPVVKNLFSNVISKFRDKKTQMVD